MRICCHRLLCAHGSPALDSRPGQTANQDVGDDSRSSGKRKGREGISADSDLEGGGGSGRHQRTRFRRESASGLTPYCLGRPSTRDPTTRPASAATIPSPPPSSTHAPMSKMLAPSVTGASCASAASRNRAALGTTTGTMSLSTADLTGRLREIRCLVMKNGADVVLPVRYGTVVYFFGRDRGVRFCNDAAFRDVQRNEPLPSGGANIDCALGRNLNIAKVFYCKVEFDAALERSHLEGRHRQFGDRIEVDFVTSRSLSPVGGVHLGRSALLPCPSISYAR